MPKGPGWVMDGGLFRLSGTVTSGDTSVGLLCLCGGGRDQSINRLQCLSAFMICALLCWVNLLVVMLTSASQQTHLIVGMRNKESKRGLINTCSHQSYAHPVPRPIAELDTKPKGRQGGAGTARGYSCLLFLPMSSALSQSPTKPQIS
eukprot:CAMPEP_0174378138 /NCGR_PEP_ID=MMETSP0811_2-20130205/121862_1 /TAXON_ID=73025 ORGANISM="Eutreptiella gymnastica-like, Strain CCMP1594" /NCGR_SAMPLE_ID=MMETSP0811_2 /ASSEMBLY_ACC=CAM_ASM_000667 /LENGTH=147 /DNA_ID=CAMNT_0015530277 /DNA_START=779 /DNA_END=1219 /DNA_ORIENTATION=+